MVVLTTFSQPTEGIRHRQPNITAFINDNNLGKGTLYIAESCLSWISDSGDGFSIEYSNISLHAVSRDLAAFSHECLFLMLDIALGDEEETKSKSGENDDNNDGTDDEHTSTELRFVPDDRGMLDAMFHAMNVCQALHPDPEDSDSDEDLYEVTDDDIQMEETDCRMANLNLSAEAFSLNNKNMELELWGIRGRKNRGVDMVEGKGVDMVEGREVDMVEGREVNMVEGKGVDMVEGRGVDMEGDIEKGRGVEDMGEGKVEVDMEEGQVYRVQGGRPFLLGSTEHQDSPADLDLAHSPQIASNFSDAES